MSVTYVDSSTPGIKGAAGVTTLASNTLSPPAGSVLYAVITGTANANAASSVTDSLVTHLTWTLVKAQTTNGCDAEIWSAPCPSAQTNMSVTVNFAASQDIALGVLVLTGAASSQVGAATAGSTSASGIPSGAVTTTAAGSLVIGVVANATNITAPTVSPFTTTTVVAGKTYQQTVGTKSGFTQVLVSSVSSSSVPVTIADTAPTIAYSMVVAEILAAAANTFNGNVASGTHSADFSTIANKPNGNALPVSPPRPSPLYIGQGIQAGSVR